VADGSAARKPPSRHPSPQVNAPPTTSGQSPKAGVAGSNPARRTECLCRSEAMTVP